MQTTASENIKGRLQILQSKLSIPFSGQALGREHLGRTLHRVLQKKLALVVAGAGYGKTTLVAQAVRQMDLLCLWYSLDASDRDPAVFMGHLLAGIQRRRPDVGKDLWAGFSSPVVSRENLRKLLTALLIQIETHICDDMIVVLDDYHLVQECCEIAYTVEYLLSHMPSNMHMIIVSRADPRLRLSRYRAGLEVIELDEGDLSFGTDEIDTLYREILKIPVDRSDIEKLHEKTGGWAAALILFYNALNRCSSGERDEKLFSLGTSKKMIFDYLEENIFESQPRSVQHFMMRSALLKRLDPDLCNAVFRLDNAQTILEQLCRKHLLTFPSGDDENCFSYHHLLREFLKDRMVRQYGEKRILQCHHEIGKALEAAGDPHGALHHFMAGAHFSDVNRLINDLMLLDINQIPIPFLTRTLDRIPQHFMHQNPRLIYIRAKLRSVGGDVWGAIGDFKTALARFKADQDESGIAGCLKDLGFHYYITGDLGRAIREMVALWGSPHKDPFFASEVAGYIILFSAIAGDLKSADHYHSKALGSLAAAETLETAVERTWLDFCHSFRFHVAGRFRKADALNTAALDFFGSRNMEIFLPIANFQAALTAFYLPEPNRGYAYAQKGLAMAKRLGVFDNQYAWLLYGRALNALGLGEIDEARQDAEQALDLFKTFSNAWGEASIYELRAMLFIREGQWAKALDAAQTGLQIIDGLDLHATRGALALEKAEACTEMGQYEKACQVLENHQKAIQGSRFLGFRYYLLKARIEANRKNQAAALAHMDAALSNARENGYAGWLRLQHPWLVSLLVECHRQRLHADFIERLFAHSDRDANTALDLIARKSEHGLRRAAERLMSTLPHKVPAPLIIRCLGVFSVSIGDRPLLKKQWKSAKATLLFKYLAVKHSQGLIPKETLLELAWPEADTRRTSSRLHVALNFLRKLLEPDLRRGVASAYIIHQNRGYRLEIGREGRIDLSEFRHAVMLAQSAQNENEGLALARYLAAESIYTGDLLEEDPYEEGFTEERETVRETYLQVLSNIVRLYAAAGQWDASITYAEKYLTHDRFAEPVYRLLMQSYANTGSLSRVAQTFQKCRTQVSEGLGCPLSRQTVDLYRKLTAK